MKKYSKKDCTACNEYPYGCDDCYSEIKSYMTIKSRQFLNKRKTVRKNESVFSI